MNVSRPIGYILIAIGILGIILAVSMITSLPDNPFAFLFGLIIALIGLILLGIGAIAAKK